MAARNVSPSPELSSIIRRLYECNALKFGQIQLKSGINSPVYVDLRSIISQPDLLIDVCKQYVPLMNKCSFDLICGVPYTALMMATYLSTEFRHPMVMRRKESKQHGTKRIIEGEYRRGQRVLIVEDLISSGSSILETASDLREAGLVVDDAIVFIDREQNGIDNLTEFDINVHSCLKFSELMNYLRDEGHINAHQCDEVLQWIKWNNCSISQKLRNEVSLTSIRKNISYGDRAQLCKKNILGRRLFELMQSKMSNLCISADLNNCSSIIKLANLAGPHIVMLKTHVDIIEDFNQSFVKQLQQLANEHNFLLFEDRKFADIGTTVAQQYSSGIFRISEWAHLVNAHLMPGPGLIKALKQKASECQEPRGCILISHLSCQGNLMPRDYAKEAYRIASENPEFIVGFISQTKVTTDPTFIHMMPGIRIDVESDPLGQSYTTPEDAIENNAADMIIVGRGITSKLNCPEEFERIVREYRRRGIDAYMNTL